MGDRAGFSLVDQTKIVTAASELARNTARLRRRRHVRLESLRRRRAPRPAAHLRGPGPGIPDIELALTRRLHHRRRPRPRPRRRRRLSNEFEIDSDARRRAPRHDHAMEVLTRMRRPPTLCRHRREPGRRGAPRWPPSADGWASTRRGAGALAIVITEAATNLVKHAGGGELLLRSARAAAARRRGARRSTAARASPTGRAACATATRPGHPGTGLGAIAPPRRRVRHLLRARSRHGAACALWAAGRAGAERRTSRRVCVAPARARRSAATPGACTAETARRAPGGRRPRPRPPGRRGRAGRGDAFRDAAPARRRRAVERHAALRSTRGAAVGVAELDLGARGRLRGASATSPAVLRRRRDRRTVSSRMNGTVGHEMRSVREFTYPGRQARCSSCTRDGLETRWDLGAIPGSRRATRRWSPAVLYRDHRRGRDDATVVSCCGTGRRMSTRISHLALRPSRTSSRPASAPADRAGCSASTPQDQDADRDRRLRDRAQRLRYAGGGRSSSGSAVGRPPALGGARDGFRTGHPHLDAVLSGRYGSETGMGLGLVGAKRLMDRCDIATVPGAGTTVTLANLRQQGELIGTLNARRTEVRPFTPAQIKLLETFADQAVIAIENVRLFKELQERNRDLTEALEQQTATSEILRVIASSPTDLQPVLEAVAESAARLCEGHDALIGRVEGDILRLNAHSTDPSRWLDVPITRGSYSWSSYTRPANSPHSRPSCRARRHRPSEHL